MSLSKLRIVALSSGVRSFRHVVFIIPFRAATISDPFISLGIRLCQGQQQTVFSSRISNVVSGISIGFPLIILS